MRVRACVSCGSVKLDFTPGNGDAILTRIGVGPLAGVARCKNCGHFGGPIEFDGEKEYKRFLEHLKQKKKK
ncbi:MAG: hypothetical protein ABIG39_03895 [Candidatus Micrarchaeota archaeon]